MLNPDRLVLDFWHAAEHLGVVADAAFGSDTARRTAWFEKWRHVLRHDPRGVSKVIDALCYLLTKGTGADVIRRELAYFRNNRSRMDYASAADAGHPIGSGAVESANKGFSDDPYEAVWTALEPRGWPRRFDIPIACQIWTF